MAVDKFNSFGGYSVGIPPVPVIDANGNVVTNILNTEGNVAVANIYAANYYYANGRPFNAGGNPYGPNTSIQYSNDGLFAGSGNLTFNDVTNLLTVPSINVNGLSNLGPVSNITITGGGAGYLLTTAGNGVIQWSPPGSGSAISNGQSNVDIATFSGNITASVGGISNVVVITTTGITVKGNTTTGNLKTDRILYANGTPYVFTTNAAGTNTQVQFNNNNAFSASANFTFNANTSTLAVSNLTLTGNANLGNFATANYVNVSYTLNGNVANFSGNLTATNANLGNLVTANYINVATQLNGNIANFTGNLTAANANLGNLVTANYINVATQLNGNIANFSGNLTAANANLGNLVTANYVNVATQLNGNTANFTGNITAINANLGNVAIANYFIGSGNNLSNIQGANVTGEVANSNYSTYADIAYSVDVGNVVGIGNIATINLDGNVYNILHGDGSWAPESNNISNANYANFAGQVTDSNQPNITSIGNLTDLTVGDLISNVVIIDGNINATGNITANNFMGRLANGNSYVEIPVVDGNIILVANGITTLTVSEFDLTVVGNIVPSANITYNLGSPTQRWKDLYVSGNTIDLNDSTITAGANGITLTNPLGGTFTVIGTGNSNTASILNGNSSIIIDENSNVNISVDTVSNVVVISTDGLLVNGNANITANLTSGNADLGNLAIANYVNIAYDLNGNIANFSGNLTSANADLGNLAIANYVNIAYDLNGNIANFSGNLTSLNAGLGNLAIANYVNVAYEINGNIANFSGNLTAANANLGNLVIANFYKGVFDNTSSSQANITSVGTLISLNVSGDSNIANLTVNGNSSFGANINLNTNWINNVGYPNVPTDAATKAYVDTMVSSGLSYHQPVLAATTTTLANATIGNTSYIEITPGDGVGAYISTDGVFEFIDGANVQTVGTRILVKDEANATWNGVYTYSNTTAIVRSTDADQYGPDSTEMLSVNDFFFTTGGIINEGVGFIVASPPGEIIFGTSNITFSIFTTSQVYDAGTGLTLTGTTFSVNTTQPQITQVGNLSSLTVTGNSNLGIVGNVHIDGGGAGYLLGTDGSGNLSWISGSNISGVIGNTIVLGTPTDGDLTTNVAYNGWTTGTYVTDGLDDLNQVSLNIAGNTFVGNIYISANTTSGPSPLTVAFNGYYIGNPTNYLWNFGDGTTSTTRNPTKTYSNTSGGQFTVTFTAYNVNGTFGGNVANGAKGSTATSTNTNYITLYTPLPIPSFTTTPTSLDTGSNVTITNTSLYATSYTINYGDGNTAVNPGNSWTTNTHRYINSANVDAIYGINLTGTNQTAGNAPPYSVTTANTNVKVYTPQSPAFSSNSVATINYFATSGGVISFRNDTPGSPGNTASFGAQQLYNFRWGDGTANSNINIQTGLAGNPGAANITHAFALSSVQQNAATTVSYVTNLSLYTGYSTSPFVSSNITITVEPEVRANFTGTANTQTDATGYSSNAQVGYLYTDYLGRDRSLFNFSNDTSPNVSFTGNLFNWTWGDTTSNTGLTSRANITHSYLNDYGSPTIGGKTVALQANGTPGTTLQSNTNTKTNYITILANPTAPSNLSSYTNVTIATASQGTSPLLAAGAADNTGGNILANGTAVTRVATTTPVATSTQVTNANTSLTGTLTAYVNNTSAGNTSFSTSGNAVGTYGALVVSADRDLHIANAAVPTGFYKVFSATISNTLASLGNGYNDFQLRHSTSGNTNTIGMVKDNLNSAPTLVTTNTVMVTATAGTYRYISGIPYYSATGSPAITVANLELQNFTGQTFRSADPFTVASGTSYEGSGSVISTQTKTLAQIDNSGNSMLTGSNVKANIGISTNYSMGNLNILLNGAVNGVSTIAANIFNVVGTSTTIQLPTKIQMYAGANSGFNEQSIAANVASNTQAAIRVVLSTAGNTPAFNGATNYYTSNAWTGAQTIAGTPEAVVRYGVLKHYAVDLSTGYLPIGPNLATGRSGLQYFTFAFARLAMNNFDVILTTGATGLSGLWMAAPGTTIDSTGNVTQPGYPGPWSTINGWLTGFQQYNGAGVPGAKNGGTNTNGCALTGADVIPLNTQISNVRYTMTLGEQSSTFSTGQNILIRIALASGQTITDVQIGVQT